MKCTSLLAALPLLQLAASQPHRRRHVHGHQPVKKDGDYIVTVVNTVYAAPTLVPEVIVYVDQYGNPVSTATEGVPTQSPVPPPPPPPPPPAPSSSAPSSSAPAVSYPAAPPPAPTPTPPTPSPPPPAPKPSAPAPAPVVSYAAAPAPSTPPSGGSSGGSSGFGIAYSPYNADGTCKSLSQVEQDFKSISTDYTLIRTYGTDCDQVANILKVAKARNNKLFTGIFDINNLESQVDIIVKAASGDWSAFHTISVGNELVNSGTASVATVVAAIGTVRGLLKTAGYTGNVVTVDTLVAARLNPSLCDVSDYCPVNCHPYFDGTVAAADAGKFLMTQIPTLQEKLANKQKKVVVAETGWPWKGQPNGAAVASLANQEVAISSIKTAFASDPGSVILLSAFNDKWKKNGPGQFEAEQSWGMGALDSPSG